MANRSKAVLAGLAAVGAAVAGVKKRGGRVPGMPGSSTPEPPPSGSATAPDPSLDAPAGDVPAVPPSDPAHRESSPPQPSNYDASGPVANTATPIPAPDLHPHEPIDEAAEEAAAAAEAAAIGGGVPDYPGLGLSEHADEALRPVEEGGGGEAEGQEITEMELVEAAQPSDTMSDAQRRIEETIEAQSNPHTGEHPEPLSGAGDGGPADDDAGPQTWSGRPAGP